MAFQICSGKWKSIGGGAKLCGVCEKTRIPQGGTVRTPRANWPTPSAGPRRLVKARSQSALSPKGERVESSHGCGV
jgi:hypothetical protein